ncbi:polypeptide N-acetylgalactosaminyltransferase 13-like [Montipora capricornis]|uniref:polypeptide N-acetylgalactosaminyltransferase 13-like n=1 Tax=Montipora capricornis TaxID=246305 RepID=UPI0035F12398
MSSRKIFNIIVITSTFWFSVTVLVLMFNSEVTRESLTMLNAPLVTDKDHHYMQGAGVNPLRPVEKHIKYPWEKDSLKPDLEDNDGMLSKAAKAVLNGVISTNDEGSRPRTVYDASLAKRTNPGGLGENGEAAYLTSDEDKKLSEERFGDHSFNWVLSDKISLDRTLKDVRSDGCKAKHETYPTKLPTTTVIICFHKERLSVLFRTIHSVINRTPPDLLSGVIVVDDFSEDERLGKPLDDHVATMSKVTVIRNTKREGLVRARLKGAHAAKGEVLTFLDSHCEATPGWAEPLLARIAASRSYVVCPAIEVLNADTFAYQGSANADQRGGFGWDLFFKWKGIPPEEQKLRKDHNDPIRTPTMAGGLFSIHREYFFDIGSYDEEMDIWGGENLELSFRVWMCGGRLEILPCSRVGHVFRKYTSPYKFPDGVDKTLSKNFNRLAEVWMDEYKELYYNKKPQARNMEYGDISERVALRKRLGCKNFKWYIENVFPDVQMPELNPPASGEVRNPASGYCLDSLGAKPEHSARMGLYICHGQGGNQMLILSSKGEIIFEEENCLDVSKSYPGAPVEILKCHGMGGNQQWEHDKKSGIIKHSSTAQCLDRGEAGSQYALMNPCDGRDSQKWLFSKYKSE